MRALAIAAVMVCVASGAKADVIYVFTTKSFGSSDSMVAGLPVKMAFDLTDSILSHGRFILKGQSTFGPPDDPQPIFSGDSSGFRQLLIQTDVISPTFLYGTLNIDLRINAIGDVTSSSVGYFGLSDAVVVSGSGADASGTVASDNGRCSSPTPNFRCFVSGTWTHSATAVAVPEPGSFVLLSLAVGALCLFRTGSVRVRQSGMT